MIATFLTADRSLTKTFYKDGTSEPYPLVREFTSFTVEYNSIEEFKEVLEVTGSTGACLLKGNLSKDIYNEPRAGLTDASEPTNLLIIDYDSDIGFESIEELLGEIDPDLANTDYIFQHSASSGITGKSGLRGHVFLFLTTPVSPAIIKQWLKKVNLTSEAFTKRIKLSRNAMALCYALDITVNQNDKLIYIAPPKLIGLEDPIESRFELHKGSHRSFTFSTTVSAEANRTKEHALIEALQDSAGLPKRVPKYKVSGDYEILTNPANCVVTESKDCGKFMRVNLNGGDSFAYWYAKDNPEVLHNFKGEPSVYLRDVAPEYFEQLQQQVRSTGLRPFVFRDTASNIFFNAEWDEQEQRLASCYRSEKKCLADFMLNRGGSPPRVVQDWTMFFDPAKNVSVDFINKQLNLFSPTKYMGVEPQEDTSFPKIEKVLRHICVDDQTYRHFIKWLAHIIQFRTKTQTAWIFSGTEGCVAGDTILNLTRGNRNSGVDRPRTIKYLYEKWSGIGAGRAFDRTITPTKLMAHKDNHTIGYHEVYDIYESGIRPVWKLTTVTGRAIKATNEHPFMRPDGSFSPMKDLVFGDMIIVQGDRLTDRKGLGRNKSRKTIHSIPHHPTAWQHIVNGKNYKRSHKARLVYEAEMNGLSYEDFLWIIKTDGERAKHLSYLREDQIVHHVDEDPTNDDVSNLVVIDKLNHDQHHAKSTGLGTHPAICETVMSIQYVGEEMTYDVTMKAPYHNYVANGFVVSNTGKGTLFHQILTPLFGQEQCHLITQDQADEQYNGYLQRNMILYLDEGDVESSRQADRMLAKFRSIITEPTIPIRQMRANIVQAPSFTNLIIATNKSMPVKLTAGDRRYNVAPRQHRKIEITLDEYEGIALELEAFAAHLKSQRIERTDALQVLHSEARTDLLELSKTVADEFFESLKEGNLDFFTERLQEVIPINDLGYINFAKIVQQWMHTAGEPIQITLDDLVVVYRYVGGNDTINAKKFGFLCGRQEFKSKQVRIKGIQRRVFDVTFERRNYGEWLDRSQKPNVIAMQR